MARTAKTKPEDKEVSQAIKTFKASSEVENFYRFIYENNLREEAKILTGLVLSKVTGSKKKRGKVVQ